MKNKLRVLMKNKQSFIAFFVLLAMAYNACENPSGGKPEGSNTGDFTPIGFYVDPDGNFTETDTGRTVLVADDKAEVVFYSDNIKSDDNDRVGLTFEDKAIIFIFEKGKNFPGGIELSSPEESFFGVFTPYDPVNQAYGLTIEQGDVKETLPAIALSKDIFTQYKNDDDLTPSQNLRMRNLHIATCIYTSMDEFFDSDDSIKANRGIFSWIVKTVAQIFFPPPVANIVAGVITTAYGAVNFMSSNPVTMMGGLSSLYDGTKLIADGINALTSVAVTGVSLNRSSVSLAVGDATTLNPTITPSNATNKSVSWSSSSAAIASVSSNGTVTGVARGSATITVTTADGGKKATCTVTITAPASGSPDGSEANPFPLTLNTWLDGNITSITNTVWYSFSVTSGTTYRVWWNDSYEGNSTKSLDVKVSATYSNGTSIFTNIDSGWNTAQSFTANQTGTVKIKVIPYTSGDAGTFAVAYSTSAARPNNSSVNTVGIVINLTGINEWELTGQTAEASPNVNKTFTVTGTYAAYRWYLDGVSVGTTSSYTFNKPDGVYQLVVVVTDSNGESRSGRCRVTVGQVTGTILNEDFEGTNSFTIVNGTQANQWYVGTAVKYGGTKSVYISNNSGTSNAYTITSTSTVHMYRDVTFPSSASPYTLGFYWRAQGENNYDYLTVRLVETSTSITAGSQLSSGTLLGTYTMGGAAAWNQASISIPAANSGTTKRLVFTWRNDSSDGTAPPAAVDNIVLTK